MDANTRDVLMALITAIITPLVILYVSKRQVKKVEDKIGGLEAKVEVYHKEVNGGFAKLLETTAELATVKEKKKGDDALNKEKEKGKNI